MKITRERIYKALNEKNSIQRYIARKYLFPILERIGFHILGDHFYEPIPNLKKLQTNYPDATPRLYPYIHIDFNQAETNHSNRLEQYGHEFFQETEKFGYVEKNHYFFPAEAISLYCFLREKKPRQMVEVGQGISTIVSLSALAMNSLEDSNTVKFVSIDPYDRLPNKLRNLDGIDVKIIKSPLESIDRKELDALMREVSLLFVDSSHVFKSGSDVEYLMREVYPKVPKNSYIHIHDIFTPYPWPLEFYTRNKWFWNEQDHLESFLSYNDSFQVEMPLYWLLQESLAVKEKMAQFLRTDDMRGYSFYCQKTR